MKTMIIEVRKHIGETITLHMTLDTLRDQNTYNFLLAVTVPVNYN